MNTPNGFVGWVTTAWQGLLLRSPCISSVHGGQMQYKLLGYGIKTIPNPTYGSVRSSNAIVGWVSDSLTQQRQRVKATKIKLLVSVFLLSPFLLSAIPANAEGLGRLFTTPGQRVMLEKLRSPVARKAIEEQVQEEITDAQEVEEEPEVVVMPRPDIPNITVNGLVKRSGGRSTAWVNGMSTITGDMESQYFDVNSHRIGRDHVHVEMDVSDEKLRDVSLKVGQSLDPDAAQITDTYQTLLGKPDEK